MFFSFLENYEAKWPVLCG